MWPQSVGTTAVRQCPCRSKSTNRRREPQHGTGADECSTVCSFPFLSGLRPHAVLQLTNHGPPLWSSQPALPSSGRLAALRTTACAFPNPSPDPPPARIPDRHLSGARGYKYGPSEIPISSPKSAGERHRRRKLSEGRPSCPRGGGMESGVRECLTPPSPSDQHWHRSCR